MNVIYPPNKQSCFNGESTVFLAGSIEMGAAVDWQKEVIDQLKDFPITFFNPRRPDWDSTWKQGQHEEPFRGQVMWELDNIDDSYIIFFYFDPNTKSPISLLELGICLGRNAEIVVCCPEGFYRQPNIAITCEMFGVKVHENLDSAIQDLIQRI